MKNKLTYQVRGRDLISGLPKDIAINSNEVAEAIHPYLLEIAASVKKVFNETPPELVADIMEKGDYSFRRKFSNSSFAGIFQKDFRSEYIFSGRAFVLRCQGSGNNFIPFRCL